MRDQLTVHDDLIIYGCRLFIPRPMRQEDFMNHIRDQLALNREWDSSYIGLVWIKISTRRLINEKNITWDLRRNTTRRSGGRRCRNSILNLELLGIPPFNIITWLYHHITWLGFVCVCVNVYWFGSSTHTTLSKSIFTQEHFKLS